MVITHTTQFHFAFFPVLLNSLLLVGMGVLFNSLTGRIHPRAQLAAPQAGLRPVDGRGFSAADLDFMRIAAPGRHEGVGERLRELLRASGVTHSERPEVVGQIMARQARVASEDRLLADLVPVFADDGHHHIPVIDGEQRLAGMITQTDLVRALYRSPPAWRPESAPGRPPRPAPGCAACARTRVAGRGASFAPSPADLG